jgi:hypothetical protein
MGQEDFKIIVECKITAHASPRWKGAANERQRVLQNEMLAKKRGEAVKRVIEQQLRSKLSDYSLEFQFDQSILNDDSLPHNTVLIGTESMGQRGSIVAARGNRSNNDEQYRRVDVDVRIARRLDEDITSEVVHKYNQPTKSKFWYVSTSAGIGLHVGAGVNVIFVELRNLYQKATGVAYAAGVGVGVSGIGDAIKHMTKKDLLRAAASASFGDEASFSTDKEVGWRDFHLRRIRYSSGSVQIVFGYEWSYISFSGLGSGAQSIPVGGGSIAADAGASLTTGVGLLYLFDVPEDYVIKQYTATEINTHTSHWMTNHKLPIHFDTESADVGKSMSKIGEFTTKVATDFRNQ